jgi:hypothetical protein
LHPVPFAITARPERRDHELPEKLKAEAGHKWMIDVAGKFRLLHLVGAQARVYDDGLASLNVRVSVHGGPAGRAACRNPAGSFFKISEVCLRK